MLHQMTALGRLLSNPPHPHPHQQQAPRQLLLSCRPCRRLLATTWTCSGWASLWPCAPSWGFPGTWLPPSSPLPTSTASRWKPRPVPQGSSPSSWGSGRWGSGLGDPLSRSGQFGGGEAGFFCHQGIWAKGAPALTAREPQGEQ